MGRWDPMTTETAKALNRFSNCAPLRRGFPFAHHPVFLGRGMAMAFRLLPLDWLFPFALSLSKGWRWFDRLTTNGPRQASPLLPKDPAEWAW